MTFPQLFIAGRRYHYAATMLVRPANGFAPSHGAA